MDMRCQIISAVVFAMYASTTAPTIVGGDAGELVAESCQLGTAHPPGYPLFTLIMHVATAWLPTSSSRTPAANANLLCAAFGALAAGLLAQCVVLCVQLGRRHSSKYSKNGTAAKPTSNTTGTSIGINDTPSSETAAWCAGVCAAGCWAFSPLVWQYAVTAEVFSLNNLLCSSVVHRTLLFAHSGALSDAYKGAFVVGLALTNQHTAVLFAAPLSLWVVVVVVLPTLQTSGSKGDTAIWTKLITLGGCGLAGLSPYLYLPWAAFVRPQPGGWGDVKSLPGLWHHLSRADYGSLQLYSGGSGREQWTERMWRWAADSMHRQSPLGGTVAEPLWACFACGGASLLLLQPLWWALTSTTKATSDAANSHAPQQPQDNNRSRKGKGSKGTAMGSEGVSPQVATAKSTATLNTSLAGSALVFALVTYIGIFHYLNNMPLDNPLLFGVQARFWMQPNWLASTFAGVGLYTVAVAIALAVEVVLTGLRKIDVHKNDNRGASLQSFDQTATMVALVVCLVLVLAQIRSSFHMSDQSNNRVFEGYADAVLAPLPKKSLLLINYDQQWTSCRYRMVCEGQHGGTTALNLAMMTFAWWHTKRELYPQIAWPGTHYVGESSPGGRGRNGGFSFEELVRHNLPKFPGGIYIGGTLTFHNEAWPQRYELVPHGMVNRILPRASPETIEVFEKRGDAAMAHMLRALPTLPILPGDDHKYSEETWEWTVGREFFDHATDHAAHLLELTLAQDDQAPALDQSSSINQQSLRVWRLLRAASWLEIAVNLDPHLKTSALKNLGLAYMHLVRTPDHLSTQRHLPPPPAQGVPGFGAPILEWAQNLDTSAMVRAAQLNQSWAPPPQSPLLSSSPWDLTWPKNKASLNVAPVMSSDGSGWKEWAADRFKQSWGQFLIRPDAPQDGSYASVRAIYDAVAKSANSAAATPRSNQQQPQEPPGARSATSANSEATKSTAKKKRKKKKSSQ